MTARSVGEASFAVLDISNGCMVDWRRLRNILVCLRLRAKYIKPMTLRARDTSTTLWADIVGHIVTFGRESDARLSHGILALQRLEHPKAQQHRECSTVDWAMREMIGGS